MNTKLPNSSWMPWSLLAVGLLSVLCLGVVEGQGHEPGLESTGRGDLELISTPGSFTISADPSIEVLWFEASGGMSLETFNYILYGDGRLIRTYTWAPGESDTREIQIGFPDARDLVALAVEGDLMEWDWDRIENQIVQTAGRVPSWTNSRVYELRIALESYSGSPEGSGQSMSKTIVASSIAYLRYEVPSVREIAAFDDLAKILSHYFRPQEDSE